MNETIHQACSNLEQIFLALTTVATALTQLRALVPGVKEDASGFVKGAVKVWDWVAGNWGHARNGGA